MLKLLALFLLCWASADCADCFGADCAHQSPVFEKPPVDPVEVSRQIELELRRQYWYYINGSLLIYQANLNMPGRLMIFYFHRSISGTYFTICSWYFDESFSEVNTMVRLGPGSSAPESSAVKIEPFALTLKMADGEARVTYNDQGQLSVNGVAANSAQSNYEQAANKCYLSADKFLRTNYWYYLNGATEINHQTLATTQRNYVLITYSNVVGTFLIISSCTGDQVQANTFVRLGPGSTNPSAPIVIQPIILESRPAL